MHFYRTGLSFRNSLGIAVRGEEAGLSMGLCALPRKPAETLPRAPARGIDSRDDGGGALNLVDS